MDDQTLINHMRRVTEAAEKLVAVIDYERPVKTQALAGAISNVNAAIKAARADWLKQQLKQQQQEGIFHDANEQ